MLLPYQYNTDEQCWQAKRRSLSSSAHNTTVMSKRRCNPQMFCTNNPSSIRSYSRVLIRVLCSFVCHLVVNKAGQINFIWNCWVRRSRDRQRHVTSWPQKIKVMKGLWSLISRKTSVDRPNRILRVQWTRDLWRHVTQTSDIITLGRGVKLFASLFTNSGLKKQRCRRQVPTSSAAVRPVAGLRSRR